MVTFYSKSNLLPSERERRREGVSLSKWIRELVIKIKRQLLYADFSNRCFALSKENAVNYIKKLKSTNQVVYTCGLYLLGSSI